MQVLSSEFVKSASCQADWPPETRVEIAVCGRSNVGKSTLLNALLGRRSLARVSRTPGRTRLVNFFEVRVKTPGGVATCSFADLPGYGYAAVSRQERATWQSMIEDYFEKRSQLAAVLLLCDARRIVLPQAPTLLLDEQELSVYLRSLSKKVFPVLTKADKLNKTERHVAALTAQKLFGEPSVVCSALQKEGLPAVWQRVFSLMGAASAHPGRLPEPRP